MILVGTTEALGPNRSFYQCLNQGNISRHRHSRNQ
ncbi:unnamed protein product [Rhodiola kirilowii]